MRLFIQSDRQFSHYICSTYTNIHDNYTSLINPGEKIRGKNKLLNNKNYNEL